MMRLRTLIIPAVIAATVAVAGGAARKHARHVSAGALEIALDVDGDGVPETVRLARYDGDAWVDVVAGGDTRSTTRLGPWGADSSLAAMDVDGDGQADLIRYFSDSDGDHAQVLLSDGVAFSEAWNGLIASTPRIAER